MAGSRLRPPLWLVIALAVFVTLLVRWPLAWSLWALPEGVACTAPTGSVWRGRCGELAVQGQASGQVAWRLHPARLFTGQLAAEVDWSNGPDRLAGTLAARPGARVTIEDAKGRLTLGSGPLANATRGLSGTIDVDVRSARLHGRVIEDVAGELQVHQLASRTGEFPVSGDLALGFPGGTSGTVKDRGGPVGLDATLTFTPEPGYVVEGFVIERPDTPRSLARMIAVLGTPDEQGRRPISVAGTY